MVSDLPNKESKKGSWLSACIGSHLEAQTAPGGGGGGGGGWGGLKGVHLVSLFPKDVNR